MGDTGESITLESIAYREIPTCDGPKSDLGSVDWRYPLNFYIDGNEHATGLLSLQVDAITDAYDFTQIQFAAGSDEAIIVLTDTNQNIEQILTAYHLINIASVDLGGSTDADGFTLTIYAREDVDLDSDLSGSGTFGLNSGAVFAEQYLFEDPDRGAPSGTLRTLIVSRFTEGSSTVTSSSTYTHDSATDEWTLAISGEHEILSLQESVSGSIRTETRTWRDLSSNVIRIEETDYKMITDAGAEIELMVEERNWADYASGTGVPIASSLKSTVWNYYETGTSFGLLESVVYPDGRWMRYTYDSEDRVATMVAGYLSNDSSTSDSVNRLTRYERFDGVMLDSETGDLKIETRLLAGQIVAQTMEFRIEEVDTDTGYLLEKTITRRYLTAVAETTVGWSSGVYEESTDWEFAGGPWEYLPRRALNTDSIETYYNYTEVFNFEKQEFAVLNERWRGVYDSVNSEFIEGTYVKEESDLSDNLIYRLSTDIESGQLIDSVVYVEFDEEGRGTSAVYLDGTTETRYYGCCGLSTFTDRSGVVTTYDYDDLGNQTGQTRDEINTYEEDSFDLASGFQLETMKQQGRDGGIRTVGRAYRDGLDRLRQQLDGADHQTTWTYSTDLDGGEVESVLYPDGGTRETTYYRDGRLRSIEGIAQPAIRYAYGTESVIHDGHTFYATWEEETMQSLPLGSPSYVDTAEKSKRYFDPLGRLIKEERPSATGTELATTLYFYDAEGLLARMVDPHGIVTIYTYDDLKRRFRTVQDTNNNGIIDLGGPDRVTEVEQSYVASGNAIVVGPALQQISRVYTSSGAEDISVSLTALTEQASYTSTYGNSTYTKIDLDQPSAGQRTTTTIQNGLTTRTDIYQADRLISSELVDGDAQVISSLTQDYDQYNRLDQTTDLRNGLTTYSYYADDRIHTTTTPDPDPLASGPGLDAQTTTLSYNFPVGGGEEITTTFEDGSTRHLLRDTQGRTTLEYGQGTYPQEWTYDYAGRPKTLITWADFDPVLGQGNSGSALTEWKYNGAGILIEKVYPDSSKLEYTYTTGGLLKTRTGGRGILTTYGYAFEQGSVYAADLLTVSYSDSTPQVTYSNYDREGRPQLVTDASGTRALSYNQGQLVETDYQSGALSGLTLSTPVDSFGRPETLELTQGNDFLYNLRYYYSNAQGTATNRVQAIGWADTLAEYTYEPNSALLSGYNLRRQGSTKSTQSRTYDNLNRLTRIAALDEQLTTINSYAYSYDDLNRRTKRTLDDNTYTDWTYDALGQLDTATRRFADNTIKPGGEFDYDFDHIGNRTQTAHNGRTVTYELDNQGLNQYTERDVPRSYPVYGEVNPNIAIDLTINGTAVTTDEGLFYSEVDFVPGGFIYPTDTDTAQYNTIGVEARKTGGNSNEVARFNKDVYLPPHPEDFAHDADGNLDYDGQWDYTWNAENRLIAMETLSLAYNAGAPRLKLDLAYDNQGRRFSKTVSEWDSASSSYVLTSSLRYVYDGWNLIAELDALQTSPFKLQTSYTWGLDLSGSLEGAGGVGGLLSVVDESGSTFYPTYDGNGNIMGYVDLDSGVSVAEFEYGPFGETLRATRSLEDQRSLVEAVGFTAGAIQSYAGTEDKTGTVTVSADGTQLTLDGNLWKSLPINGQLTETTVLRFSFRSDTAAEWCGVGFDNDGTIETGPGSHYYKISGYDDYSVYGYNESYEGYTEYVVGSGWKQVEIPIGQTANLISYDRMVFICDQDGTSQGNFQIKDLQIINTSEVSKLNPSSLSFRFSTKYQDAETELYYYGYRFYDPVTGRWPSRDPIEERGGLNLYAFVLNNPIVWVDYLGNDKVEIRNGNEIWFVDERFGYDLTNNSCDYHIGTKINVGGFDVAQLDGPGASSNWLDMPYETVEGIADSWRVFNLDDFKSRINSAQAAAHVAGGNYKGWTNPADYHWHTTQGGQAFKDATEAAGFAFVANAGGAVSGGILVTVGVVGAYYGGPVGWVAGGVSAVAGVWVLSNSVQNGVDIYNASRAAGEHYGIDPWGIDWD